MDSERQNKLNGACVRSHELSVDSQRLSKLASAFQESLRVSSRDSENSDKPRLSRQPKDQSGLVSNDRHDDDDDDDDDDDEDCSSLLASLCDLQTQLQREITHSQDHLHDQPRTLLNTSVNSRTTDTQTPRLDVDRKVETQSRTGVEERGDSSRSRLEDVKRTVDDLPARVERGCESDRAVEGSSRSVIEDTSHKLQDQTLNHSSQTTTTNTTSTTTTAAGTGTTTTTAGTAATTTTDSPTTTTTLSSATTTSKTGQLSLSVCLSVCLSLSLSLSLSLCFTSLIHLTILHSAVHKLIPFSAFTDQVSLPGNICLSAHLSFCT